MSDIIAIGGGGFLAEPRNFALEKYILEQTGKPRPKVLMIPTARGDDAVYVAKFYAACAELGAEVQHLPFFDRTPDVRALVLAQDAIFVGGGNTRSMLAVWREWGLPQILKDACEAGIVLGGQSAGAICWFEQGSPIRGPIGFDRWTAWASCRAVVARITTARSSAGRHITRS